MNFDWRSLMLVVIGVFALCGAGLDWDWFMNNRKARAFVALLGRGGARVFYGLIGTTLIVVGLALAAGWIDSPSAAHAR